VKQYLSRQNASFRILDIGCGNGWFTHLLATSPGVDSVTGLDINEYELQHAVVAFGGQPKLKWFYGDLFSAILPLLHYHHITLNACVQYFPDFHLLIRRLNELLVPGGEIHILDSPFFRTEEVLQNAAKKSLAYYTAMGHPEMAKDFKPHLWSSVEVYPNRILYKPSRLSSLLRKLKSGSLVRHSNPYRWICIKP
jgi:SAM-dependent methyltransferase